ncbi:MAG TPA: DUF3616 domain-containing protein [Trichocoleus sp.]
MSSAQPLRQITLQVRDDEKAILKDLSAVRCIGEFVWFGADEGCALERLTLNHDTASDHQTFPVIDYLDLPNPEGEEIDIEGLAYADYYLWVVGSHSLKRKKPKPNASHKDTENQLGTITCEENRYLIGRIPLVNGQLFRECPHPEDATQTLTAAQIKRKKTGNQLTHALRNDPHLGPYITAKIPGKENGFDIEGIAVTGDRVFLGLRGPVLRGWAVLLELTPKQKKKEKKPGILELKALEDGFCYRKHFLDLAGMGIRDLCWDGEDLLILAGPTMDISGLASIYRIPNAVQTLTNHACLKPDSILEILDNKDSDKAEGVSLLSSQSKGLMVVYDAPSAERLSHDGVKADVFTLP